MRQNALRTAGDRLGLFAYLFVMGGGRPYWQALFANPEAEERPDDDGVAVRPKDPFIGTAPLELKSRREREPEQAATR